MTCFEMWSAIMILHKATRNYIITQVAITTPINTNRRPRPHHHDNDNNIDDVDQTIRPLFKETHVMEMCGTFMDLSISDSELVILPKG